MKVAIIMYPWKEVDPSYDSSLRMLHELQLRGHEVATILPRNLTIRESTTMGICDFVNPMDIKEIIDEEEYFQFHEQVSFERKMVPLNYFDAIILRANPPIDMVMLDFLESVKDEVYIMNDIDGLRKSSNKIYTAALYDQNDGLIPKTYISRNIEYLQSVIDENIHDKMILKPLDGFGGSGVVLIDEAMKGNVGSLLEFYINGKNPLEENYVILQEYVEGADEGDIRVLMLAGEPIGCIKRVPKKGDNRSNISAGGHAEIHELTETELAICKKIAPKLREDGLDFVGIDIINGKLIEINVTSPGGIMEVNDLCKINLQAKVIDYVESVVAGRKNNKITEEPVAEIA